MPYCTERRTPCQDHRSEPGRCRVKDKRMQAASLPSSPDAYQRSASRFLSSSIAPPCCRAYIFGMDDIVEDYLAELERQKAWETKHLSKAEGPSQRNEILAQSSLLFEAGYFSKPSPGPSETYNPDKPLAKLETYLNKPHPLDSIEHVSLRRDALWARLNSSQILDRMIDQNAHDALSEQVHRLEQRLGEMRTVIAVSVICLGFAIYLTS